MWRCVDSVFFIGMTFSLSFSYHSKFKVFHLLDLN